MLSSSRPVKKTLLFRIQSALVRSLEQGMLRLPWSRLALAALVGLLLHSERHHVNLTESALWKNWIPAPFQSFAFEFFSVRPFALAEGVALLLVLFAWLASRLSRALRLGSGPQQQTLHFTLLAFVCLTYPNRLVWACALSWFFAVRILESARQETSKRSDLLVTLGFAVNPSSDPYFRTPSRFLGLLVGSFTLDALLRLLNMRPDFLAALPLMIACSLITLLGVPRAREGERGE